MKSYHYLLLIAGAVGIIALAGCTEDPDSKAAKDARIACEKAIEVMQSTGDVEKAQAALARVPISQLRGKDIAGLVAMIKGSMLLESAGTRASYGSAEGGAGKAGLATLANREAVAMSPLADKLFEYKRLDGDKARLQKTIEGAQTSLAELRTTLAGTNNDGLEPQLAMAQAEVSNLEKEKADLDAKADAAIEEANKLQAQAQELFNKADQTTGDDREKLKQQGYDLLLGKGGGESKDAILMRGQAAMDEVSQIESKARIARARTDKLSKDVQSMREQIPALEKTASGAALKGSLDDIASRQAKLNSEIGTQLGEIEKVSTEYNALADAAADLYKQAGESFATAASGKGGTPGAAKLALADSKYRAGMMLSSVAAANGSLGTRASALAKGASDGYTIKKLEAIAATHAEKQKAAAVAAVALLGEACDTYKGITGLAKDAKCAVVASNVFAYLEKLKLGGKAAMEGMADELKSLNDRGIECNDKFAETTAGKMLAVAMRTPGSGSSASVEGVKAAALEQAKAAIKTQFQQVFAMPQEQRKQVAAAMATQLALSDAETKALDSMVSAGAFDDAVVEVLAQKAMAMAAQAMAQSPEAMKPMIVSQLKQSFEAVFATQGPQRQAMEAQLKNGMAQLGLSEAELKSVSDMFASGKVDNAVLNMLADKTLATMATFAPQKPAAPANKPSGAAPAPAPAETPKAEPVPTPAPAEANSTAAPASEPNSAAR